VSLGPIIRDCISEDGATAIESSCCNWTGGSVKCWKKCASTKASVAKKWRIILFRRVRASLSQKWIVPSEPEGRQQHAAKEEHHPYRKWRTCRALGGMRYRSLHRSKIGLSHWESGPGGGI
jgi:hypothetical protein